jgi:hypothetical protein
MTLIQTEFTLSNPHFNIPGKREHCRYMPCPPPSSVLWQLNANVATVPILQAITDTRRLTTETSSEKCFVGRLRRCANVKLHKPR